MFSGTDGTFAVLKDLATVASSAALAQPLEKKIQNRYGAASSAVIRDHLRCNICDRLFQQATLTPCCGETFCHRCVVSRLAAAKPQNACPSCHEVIDPQDLSSNKVIQESVDAVLRALPESATSVPTAAVSNEPEPAVADEGRDGSNGSLSSPLHTTRSDIGAVKSEVEYFDGVLVKNNIKRGYPFSAVNKLVCDDVKRVAAAATKVVTAVHDTQPAPSTSTGDSSFNVTLPPQCLPPGTVRVVADVTSTRRPIPLGGRLAMPYRLKQMRATNTNILPSMLTR